MLEVNTKAIDFELEDFEGNKHKLSDFKGKKVILYFYPKDSTPGCTKQACNFSLYKEDFEKKNAVVIGISKDSKESHKKFIDNNNLNILLLSDPTLEVMSAYGVYKEKTMCGKTSMGVVRSTYLIDEDGIVKAALEKVNAEKNPSQMLKLLD